MKSLLLSLSAVFAIAMSSVPSLHAAPCAQFSSSSVQFNRNGGYAVVNVIAPASCHWTLSKDSGNVMFASGWSSSGSASVTYYVYPNTSSSVRTMYLYSAPVSSLPTLGTRSSQAAGTPMAPYALTIVQTPY